jgi:hypothetical protein
MEREVHLSSFLTAGTIATNTSFQAGGKEFVDLPILRWFKAALSLVPFSA